MKPVVAILFFALGIQGVMSENDIGGSGCTVPAICKAHGFIETAWLPISRPVCEAGMERTKGGESLKSQNGSVGPKGDNGQQGKVGQAGPKGDNGTRGENGSKGEGVKGEKGIEGLIGPKGEPRSVDSLVFKNIIKVLCPVKHEKKCFFPVIGREFNYDDGVKICESLGGHLANIYSQTHMDDVMKYIRENRMGGSSYQTFRLGLKYDPKAKKLTLRDGTDAPAGLKWITGAPYTVESNAVNADRTTVILFVNSYQSSTYQYLFNRSPSDTSYVLCEIE